MCGILYVERIDGARIRMESLRDAVGSVRLRGPDHESLLVSHDGSRALYGSVLRVAPRRDGIAGPVSGPEGEAFAYNGELYGFPAHPLASPHDGLDTDVIQRMCRSDSVQDLFSARLSDASRGFFAFLHATDLEAPDSEVVVATDVLGEKSLFVLEAPGVVAVSSTFEALDRLRSAFGIRGDVDADAMRTYFLTRNLIHRPNGFVRAIRRLNPGRLHRLDRRRGRFVAEGPDAFDAVAAMAASAHEIDEEGLLAEVHAAWQNLNPGRTAVIVSGGIDSTVLAARVHLYLGPTFPTVSLTFGRRDPVALTAPGLARSLGLTEHHEISVTPAAFSEHMRALYGVIGSPLPTHSYASYAFIADWAAGQGIRVVIGGDGLDEIANGYAAYQTERERPSTRSISEYSRLRPPGRALAHIVRATSPDDGPELDDIRRFRSAIEATGVAPGPATWGASKWLDVSGNLYAAGLLAGDLIAGSRGLEHRSPWVSLHLVAHHVFARTHRHPDGTFLDKVLARALWRRHLPQHGMPAKSGFSGFPNEAARSLLGGAHRYSHLEDLLCVGLPRPGDSDIDRRQEWKLLNGELWLRARDGVL